MLSEREATDTEAGLVIHRAGTAFAPASRCCRGHLAPRYWNGRDCVACAKLRVVARYGQKFRRYADYDEARAAHLELGGWLLDRGHYFSVSDNPRYVQTLRGLPWMRRCDQLQVWDEVELQGRGIW